MVRRSLVAALAILALTSTAGASGAPAYDPPAARALLERFCVPCHNDKLKTAGLALDTIEVTKVTDDTRTWEKVVRKLRAGVMPPAGRPRPDKPAYDGLASWLEAELDGAAALHPDPGRTESFHRLNRAEYQNAIRDLLALPADVSALLPADDASYGFDNMAAVQRMSPTLMERYLAAAQRVSREAIGTPLPPTTETFRFPDDLPQDDQVDALPFGTRGGTLIHYYAPVDGAYSIRAQLARLVQGTSEEIPAFDRPQPLEISIDGQRAHLFTLPASDAPEPGQRRQDRRSLDASWEVRLPIKAGPREIAITFLNRTPALLENLVQPFLRPFPGSTKGGGLYTTRKGAYLSSVEIAGPFNAAGGGDTPSRRRIFVCHAVTVASEANCARTILLTLTRRAYRRPVTDADVRPLIAFYRKGRTSGSFERGIERALQALLMGPEFLFRVERDPRNVPPHTNYVIRDLELASRLSFFLWSSIPDDELITLAAREQLHDPAVLHQQVRRMLADARSQALVNNFAGQWLFLRNVPSVAPDPRKDPNFDESLRQAFRRETELFVESILREDRSALDLLTADYTFVNERLARHYGIPNVLGSHFRRVTLPDEHRRGLLGHGSILSVTAYPHRTSPVLRGKWILENLLGTPPPPPPPNVPDLKDTNAAGQVLTMRERMAQHRANPVCASCHAMMDPPGFALENFDFVGRWRTVDETFQPIDPTGVLPDGTKFDGVKGLRDALLSRPEQFVGTMTEKLLAYALGRGVEYEDAPAVRKIVRDAAGEDFRFSAIVAGVVNAMPFRMRRSAPSDVVSRRE